MTSEQIAYLNSLAPPSPDFLGTGADLLIERPSDHPITLIRKVAALAAVGAPESADLSGLFAGQSYNQGQTSACVAYSEAGLCSMDDYAQDRVWTVYDAAELYRRAGGTGQNGVETRLTLQQAIDLGVPILGGGSQKVIESYLFVPQVVGQFRETLKAAIAAGQPCTLALLLPQNFGTESSGAKTSAYHQVIACSYDSRWCGIHNSWGDSWGNRGFGRLEWDYLEADGLQQRFCYAYTVRSSGVSPTPTPTPIPVPIPTPIPTPNKRYYMSGEVLGAGAVTVKQGMVLTLGNAPATILVSETHSEGGPGPDPDPIPLPGALTITPVKGFPYLTVTLSDPATGARLSGLVSATVNGAPYPVGRPRTTPAYGALMRTPSGSVVIHARADDGREGSVTV